MIGPPAAATSPAPEAARSAPAADKLASGEPAPSVPAPLAVKHTEFGVDVGGANSVGGLRALWRGLLKSRSNAPLAALQPIIVVKERENGLGMQLRLVAGPLGDAAAAARICAKMSESERPCETTVFDGQRLAMQAEGVPAATEAAAAKSSEKSKSHSEKSASLENSAAEPSASAKSASEKPAPTKPVSTRQAWRRRSYVKRVVVEEPPKKPETSSSLSSFFSSRIHPQ
jgi:hypothetical protein